MSNTSNKRKLVIALHGINLETDPHKVEDLNSMFLAQQIYSSLFKFSSDGTIIHDLADTIQKSTDGLTYTITLKKGIKFSDGSLISAKHVVASLKRAFVKGAGLVAEMAYIEGYNAVLKSKDPEAVGITYFSETEFKIVLNCQTDLLVTHLALPDLSILKIENATDNLPVNIFSGNYKIVAKTTELISLEKTESTEYSNAHAPNIVNFVKIAQADIINAMDDSRVDSVEQYYLSTHDTEKSVKRGWQKIVHSLSHENFVFFNPKMLNREDRILLSGAINSDEVISWLGVSALKPAYGLIPMNLPGAILNPYKAIEKSSMLKSCKETTVISLLVNKNNTLHMQVSHFLQEKWAILGCKIEMQVLDQDEYYKKFFKKDYQAALAGKGLDYPDGISNLGYFRTDIENNFLPLENSSLDAEISALSRLSFDERIRSYIVIQENILRQETVKPLFFGHNTSGLWSSKVKSVPSHPFGFQFLKLVEIEM